MEKCKFCEAELEEGTTLCPSCGKENEEPAEDIKETEAAAEPAEVCEVTAGEELPAEAEAPAEAEEKAPREKKPLFTASPRKIAAAAVALVVLVALLVTLVLGGMDKSRIRDPKSVTFRDDYTVSDEKLVASADRVVATAGDRKLTVGMLQLYYWNEVTAFINQMYSYGMDPVNMGLDPYMALDVQTCALVENRTWQQYFLESALNSWHHFNALDIAAEKAGYQLDASLQADLDAMPQTLADMALSMGFADAQTLLNDRMGAGATLEDYYTFMEVYYHGSSYANHVYETYEPAEGEIDAMYAKIEPVLAQQGITKDAKVVDVRHILIMPEGATSATIRTETFPEEAWAASEAKAQQILDQWLAGEKTEESFAELAKEHSMDGNAAEGGIYKNLVTGQMVEEFDSWCFDPSREIGDCEIVKTVFGYHVMFYCADAPSTEWYDMTLEEVRKEAYNRLAEEATAQMPMEVNYRKILLSLVTFD